MFSVIQNSSLMSVTPQGLLCRTDVCPQPGLGLGNLMDEMDKAGKGKRGVKIHLLKCASF